MTSEEREVARLAEIARGEAAGGEAFWEAVRGLNAHAENPVDRWAALCRSSDWAVRAVGCSLLGDACNPERQPVAVAMPAVLTLLQTETHPDVLCAAGWACHIFADPSALDALVVLAMHPSADVRHTAANALPSCVGEPEDPRAIAALIALSADADEDVRDWATFGLAQQVQTDTTAVRDALAARARDTHDDARAEALLGLALRADPRALEGVRRDLMSENVGRLSVETAAVLADPSLLPALTALREWWDVDVDLVDHAIVRSRVTSG